MRDVPAVGDWRTRFDAIRHNYQIYERAVLAGIANWGYPRDPYIIADWDPILTKIERVMWDEIRSEGLPFWPQFPVGKFMVDFADPMKKIAIECDGAEFHDPDKDARRDVELLSAGWKTFRIQGRECFSDCMIFHTIYGEEVKFENLRYA